MIYRVIDVVSSRQVNIRPIHHATQPELGDKISGSTVEAVVCNDDLYTVFLNEPIDAGQREIVSLIKGCQ